MPLEEGRRQFEVNVFGLARLTQLALPIMRKQKAGKIVNITSVGGKMHEPFGSWYHATKFAVEGMSDCLRMELAPFGIDVIVIEPGAIKTEWTAIARDNLLKYSGDSAYAHGAQAHARMFAMVDTGPGRLRRRKSLRRRSRAPSRRGVRAHATPPARAPNRSCCCAGYCPTECSTASCALSKGS